MRIALDGVGRLAANADEMNLAARGASGVGDGERKGATPGDDGQRAVTLGPDGSIGATAVSFRWVLGHCCSAHKMSGRNARR